MKRMSTLHGEAWSGFAALTITLYHSILSRLREAGWKKELALMDVSKLEALSKFHVVQQASKLPNRGEHGFFIMYTGVLTDVMHPSMAEGEDSTRRIHETRARQAP